MLDKIHSIKLHDGQRIQMSEEAGVYIAAHIQAEHNNRSVTYRSHDDNDKSRAKEGSFLHPEFNERKFRNTFGLERGEDSAASESNHYSKQVKRQNLIQLFLQGNEVDDYIVTHLYGEVGHQENDFNQSVILADLMDESF